MNRKMAITMSLMLVICLTSLLNLAYASSVTKPIVFANKQLEKVVASALKKQVGKITLKDALSLTSLTVNRLNSNGQTKLYVFKDYYMPPTDITDLRHFKNLKELNLMGSEVYDIKTLKNLGQLTHLNLGTNFIKDLTPLASLKNLISLNLENNNVEDLTSLKYMPKLKYLILNGNQIKSLNAVSNLSGLRSLMVSGNPITDLSPLKGSSKALEYLNLDNTSVRDFSVLSACINLKELRLSNTAIQDLTCVTRMPKLQFLSLMGCKNIKSLKPINGCKVLTTLHIQDLKYPKLEEIATRCKSIPNMDIRPLEKQAFDQKLKKILSEIIKPNMSDYDKYKAIHDYVVLYLDYDTENFNKNTLPETSLTAYGALKTKRAVCQGYSSLYQSLCEAQGLYSKLAQGYINNTLQSHAWNIIKIGSKFYHVDTTWDDPGNQATQKIQYTYFVVSDPEMLSTRFYDQASVYPVCNDDTFRYDDLQLAHILKAAKLPTEYVNTTFEVSLPDAKLTSIRPVTITIYAGIKKPIRTADSVFPLRYNYRRQLSITIPKGQTQGHITVPLMINPPGEGYVFEYSMSNQPDYNCMQLYTPQNEPRGLQYPVDLNAAPRNKEHGLTISYEMIKKNDIPIKLLIDASTPQFFSITPIKVFKQNGLDQMASDWATHFDKEKTNSNQGKNSVNTSYGDEDLVVFWIGFKKGSNWGFYLYNGTQVQPLTSMSDYFNVTPYKIKDVKANPPTIDLRDYSY